MKKIKLNCPPSAWPKNFSGSLALGILEALNGSEESLWLIFEVQDGNLLTVTGMLYESDDVPNEIRGGKPDVVAVASLKTWSLAKEAPAEFASAAERGHLHIDGDFRTFGRSSPGLVRLATDTNFWANLNLAVEQLR